MLLALAAADAIVLIGYVCKRVYVALKLRCGDGKNVHRAFSYAGGTARAERGVYVGDLKILRFGHIVVIFAAADTEVGAEAQAQSAGHAQVGVYLVDLVLLSVYCLSGAGSLAGIAAVAYALFNTE